MKNGQSEEPRKGRRFQEKEDGPVIRRWYARMPTAELAERMGLTVRQITNYELTGGQILGYDGCYDSGTCVHENLVDQRFSEPQAEFTSSQVHKR